MSRLVLLNYADRQFRSAQRLNSRSGKGIGGFDGAIAYGPDDIDAQFAIQHKDTLTAARGGGYWLWKPHLILRTLRQLRPGDWLFYCDAGAVFVGSIQPVVRLASELGLDVVTFEVEHLERQYTKRDVFVELSADVPSITDTPQRCGGFQLYRVSKQAIDFAATLLARSTIDGLITDSPNRFGRENYPDFIAHRHDQSILSVLSKQWGIPAFRDPSQFGNPFMDMYESCTYPQLIELTRQRDVPRWKAGTRWVRHWLIGRGR
ncbi:hypothetical protein LEM8419_02788 [Neolewinella maritima]|uniref:Uncharacterized protein n=1 Tax=Neolewinella maritima TaxID=1383882 RepID=A0ABN8F4M0_9BACT|nr:hypothetical protein [Neolewinella maritima]CAH1001880.1 hypothetical protein LEM8419_02788 [Neolewinella maritima]